MSKTKMYTRTLLLSYLYIRKVVNTTNKFPPCHTKDIQQQNTKNTTLCKAKRNSTKRNNKPH